MSSFTPWTAPDPGTHPRIWLTPATLSTIQTRVAGTHLGPWMAVLRHGEASLGRPASAWAGSTFEPEDLAALAFAALVDPARTDLAAKASEVAWYLADQAFDGGALGRARLLGIALIYDWAYDSLSVSARAALRAHIAAGIEQIYGVNSQDKIQGPSLARSAVALAALPAILSDGSPSEDATWAGWMDYLLDEFDLGGSPDSSYLSALRYFGGPHLGSGPFAPVVELQELLGRLLPALSTSVGVTWEAEAWWDSLIHWILWSWRGDRTFHRTGAASSSPAPYSAKTVLFALQVAAREANQTGQFAAWLADEIRIVGNQAISDAEEIWRVLWWDPDRAPLRPTTALYGNQMKIFSPYGAIAFRDSWDELGTSMVLQAPRYFLGGSQLRRGGSLVLSTKGRPILYDKGSHDPDQDFTPKTSDPDQTGHRWTFAQRLPAAGCAVRVFDTNEPTENLLDSFQRLLTPDTKFGVLQGDGSITITNDGGQLVPKNTAGTLDRPGDRVQLAAEPKWTITPDPLAFPPIEDPKFCYALVDLKGYNYSAKVTSARRHLVWVKAGAIPGWRRPVILLVDDLSTHIDAVGKLTQILQFNVAAAPTMNGSWYQWDRTPARLLGRILKPTIEKVDVSDYAIAGVTFDATNPAAFDDPAGIRTEFNPSASTGTPQFVAVLCPCSTSESSPPTVTLIDDGTYLGATINGIQVKVRKASPYAASVSTSTDTTPPATPTGLTATPKTGYVDLAWTAIGGDREFYRVYRGPASGGPWTPIGEPATNSYRDETVVNGTTYWFTVAAVDTSGNEGSKATAVSATPALGYAGPIRHVPPRHRTGREARYSRERRGREYEDPDPFR